MPGRSVVGYSIERYSARTRAMRALADIADELELDRDAAAAVADGLEALEKLEQLRKQLLELGAEGEELGLTMPTAAALDKIQDPDMLTALLRELEELVSRAKQEQLAADAWERAKRDMRMLMLNWLMAAGIAKHHSTLVEMRALLDGALEEGLFADESLTQAVEFG